MMKYGAGDAIITSIKSNRELTHGGPQQQYTANGNRIKHRKYENNRANECRSFTTNRDTNARLNMLVHCK